MQNGGRMMDELISKAAAIKTFTGKPFDYYHTSYIASELKDLPAVDAAPAVHGRWLFASGYFTCSKCKYSPLHQVIFRGEIVWWKDIREEMPYCPNCGAKMDGK